MLARKFAIAIAIVGAAMATAGLFGFANGFGGGDRDAAPTGDILDESTGLPPIEDTVAFLRQRADDRPSDYLTRTALAGALLTMGHEHGGHALFADAEDVALAALAINPDHQPAKLELARALSSLHRFDESRQLAQTVLAEDPSSNEAVALVAAADLQLGSLDEAEAGYQRLALIDRNANVVSGLAQVAEARGDREGAVALAEEALELSEQLVRRPNAAAFYHYQLGRFRFLDGDVGGAVEELERALALDPDHPGATEELALIDSLTSRARGPLGSP
jgi:tetratricopeptide (TPR) repeat protein